MVASERHVAPPHLQATNPAHNTRLSEPAPVALTPERSGRPGSAPASTGQPAAASASAAASAEVSIRADAPAAPMGTQTDGFKVFDGLARRRPDGCQLDESRRRQTDWANRRAPPDAHRLSIEPHQGDRRPHQQQQRQQYKQQQNKQHRHQHQHQNQPGRRASSPRLAGTITSASSMSDQQRDATATPLSSSSLMGDPLVGLSGSNRATTTERRTTTTTTTKRVVKSSDDYLPSATDIQQVRSESRTGSISSTSPLFGNSSLASSQQQQQQQQSQTSTSTTTSSRNTSKAFTEGFSSPVVQETEEGRVLKLRFDLTQYEPDEILVKTVDNRLTVHAKHEEKSESKSVYREYNREFHLPEGTDVELIRSTLSKDGVLTVDLPLPKTQLVGSSRRIPIDRI